ncbi:hypothetical protein LEMLEM_LOCUS6884, partial [Lemmus lemmus]
VLEHRGDIPHNTWLIYTVTLPGKARGGEKITASLSRGRRAGDLAGTSLKLKQDLLAWQSRQVSTLKDQSHPRHQRARPQINLRCLTCTLLFDSPSNLKEAGLIIFIFAKNKKICASFPPRMAWIRHTAGSSVGKEVQPNSSSG